MMGNISTLITSEVMLADTLVYTLGSFASCFSLYLCGCWLCMSLGALVPRLLPSEPEVRAPRQTSSLSPLVIKLTRKKSTKPTRVSASSYWLKRQHDISLKP